MSLKPMLNNGENSDKGRNLIKYVRNLLQINQVVNTTLVNVNVRLPVAT